MNRSTIAVVIAVLALVVSGGAVALMSQATGDLGFTNLDQLELDAKSTTAALDVDQTSTGNIAIFRDGGSAVLTIADGGVATFTGNPVVPSGSVSAGEVADVSRAVNLPLRSWYDCDTNAGADLGFSEGSDALPDFSNSSTDGLGMVILFDDTGGTPDVGSEICSNLVVPPDYASGGALLVRALKDTHTGVAEWLNAKVSINGAALGTGSAAATSGTATTAYTLTPAGTYSAGASVSATLWLTSTGTISDTVSVAGVEWVYTATQ